MQSTSEVALNYPHVPARDEYILYLFYIVHITIYKNAERKNQNFKYIPIRVEPVAL